MWNDPIVEEVREVRQAHAVQYNYNLRAIYQSIKKAEATSGRKYITLPAKRLSPVGKADDDS